MENSPVIPEDSEEFRENKSNKEQIIKELIDELRENRVALKQHIKDLENIKTNIDKLFPSTLDARYMRFFEEKVKTATQLFSSILETRKEIHKSLKDEIDIRYRHVIDLDEEEIEFTAEQLGEMAARMKDFMKKEEKRKFELVKGETKND
jgi:hypothetical protein